jgi:hypothetical protein
MTVDAANPAAEECTGGSAPVERYQPLKTITVFYT